MVRPCRTWTPVAGNGQQLETITEFFGTKEKIFQVIVLVISYSTKHGPIWYCINAIIKNVLIQLIFIPVMCIKTPLMLLCGDVYL